MDIETSDGSGTIIERITDNGDGTGTLTTAEGETPITGLPIPEPEPPAPEVIAAQAISDEISLRMDEAVTIGDVKLAVTDGLLAALATLRGEA